MANNIPTLKSHCNLLQLQRRCSHSHKILILTTMITPHDFGSNVVHISVRKNPQKQRKPNADPHKRAQTYWDGQSPRHQREYDARLDGLPDLGVADTVSESHSAAMHVDG